MNKQKWYSLIDKVYRVENLENAWKQVKANRGAAGVDGVTIKDFGKDLHGNIEKLSKVVRIKLSEFDNLCLNSYIDHIKDLDYSQNSLKYGYNNCGNHRCPRH